MDEALRIIGEMREQLSYYDYLLPGDFVPEPAWRKRWFRWGPSFEITQDMMVWAGTIARARSLMDLKAANYDDPRFNDLLKEHESAIAKAQKVMPELKPCPFVESTWSP